MDIKNKRELLDYLRRLQYEKYEFEQEQYSTKVLLRRTDEEIEKVEIYLEAVDEPN